MEAFFNHVEVFKSELCGLYSYIFLQISFKYEIFLHLCTIIRFYEALFKHDLNQMGNYFLPAKIVFYLIKIHETQH